MQRKFLDWLLFSYLKEYREEGSSSLEKMLDQLNKKPRNIKAWPELTSFAPLLSMGDARAGRSPSRFNLDFSLVNSVDALGLSIFLARLAQMKGAMSRDIYTLTLPVDQKIVDRLSELKLEENLASLGLNLGMERDLFDSLPNTKLTSNMTSGSFETIISVVPGEIGQKDRDLIEIRRKIKYFLRQDSDRHFSHEQVLSILMEMIKNTFDHSGRPAVLGLSIRINSNPGLFSFFYCDTGTGIGRNVRHFIDSLSEENVLGSESNDLSNQMRRLSKKGGFADLLHWALRPGNSTKKGNGVNFGLGLMVIVEGAKKLNMKLRLKDADSIWLLSELAVPYSHKEIRQKGIVTCSPPLMYFSGDLEF